MPRISILDAPLDVEPFDDAVRAVIAMAGGDDAQGLILHRDAHGLLAARDSATVCRAEALATRIYPDGMPLVWLSRWYGFETERIYGPDLMRAVLVASRGRPIRHLFLGGAAGVAERLSERVNADFPGVAVVGTLSPRIEAPERVDPDLVETIESLAPSVLWVGLGCPKQDIWMATYRPLLTVPVMVGCGAAFDFLAGTKPQAPRWMQRSGLEWLFRLGTEPCRLGPRYLRVVPRFVLLALAWMVRTAR